MLVRVVVASHVALQIGLTGLLTPKLKLGFDITQRRTHCQNLGLSSLSSSAELPWPHQRLYRCPSFVPDSTNPIPAVERTGTMKSNYSEF